MSRLLASPAISPPLGRQWLVVSVSSHRPLQPGKRSAAALAALARRALIVLAGRAPLLLWGCRRRRLLGRPPQALQQQQCDWRPGSSPPSPRVCNARVSVF